MAKKKTIDTVIENDIQPTVNKTLTYKVSIKCKNQHQKDFLNILKDDKNQICFGVGSAGSGKSYLSLAYALNALKDDRNKYNKIIVIVPTVEAGNMSIGFLRGDLEQKMLPYALADRYTMEKILTKSGNVNSKEYVNNLFKEDYIEYRLMNFLRGSNLDDCIVLINEAENFDQQEMLLILTRIGENCKMIVTGDPKQMDRKDIKRSGKDCGLMYAIDRLVDIDGVEVTTFTDSDIIRNQLIQKIIDKW